MLKLTFARGAGYDCFRGFGENPGGDREGQGHGGETDKPMDHAIVTA
jgi:hypothetical protein